MGLNHGIYSAKPILEVRAWLGEVGTMGKCLFIQKMNNTHESYWRGFWSSWSSWSPRTLAGSWPGALATNRDQSRDLMGSVSTVLWCHEVEWRGTMSSSTRTPEQAGAGGWPSGSLGNKSTEGGRERNRRHFIPSAKIWVPPRVTDKMQTWIHVVLERCQLAYDFPRIGIPAWSQLQKVGWWTDEDMKWQPWKLYCYSLLTRMRVPSCW